MARNYDRHSSSLSYNSSSLGHLTPPLATLAYPSPSAPALPPLTAMSDKAKKMKKLEQILARYEVSIADANELAALEGYEIVFICDDSGSMSMSSVPLSERRLGVPSATRWDELKDTVTTVAEVACCFDDDGIDVYFLNRSPVYNVSSCNDPRLIAAFQAGPGGRTPLTKTIQRVIADKKNTEKPLLLLIATDGEPDDGPAQFKYVIERAIKRNAPICKFQILACTADDSQIQWINDFDDAFYEVDATDDYYSERAEILKTGRLQKFTRGDWIMKALLGPILRKFDEWDEAPAAKSLPPPSFARQRYPTQGNVRKSDPACCLVM